MAPPSESAENEIKSVEKLRHLLKEELDADMYEDYDMFIRFLRARNHDIKASETMLRNHIKWRKLRKMDSFLSCYSPSEFCKTYLAASHLGYTKDGYPIVYLDVGHLDIRGYLKVLSLEEVNNFYLHRFETDAKMCKSQSEKLKIKIDQWVYIFNFEDYPLSQAVHKPSIAAVIQLVKLYEANYPERLKAAIIINASWYFQIFFSFVKPVLSGTTVKKIKIFGKSDWKDELLDLIHAEDLPAFLGGERCDPDGDIMCRNFISHGGLVPEKLFKSKSKSNFRHQAGVKKTVIHPFSKTRVILSVTLPGSDIEWEFETKERDIAFCILYQEHDGSDGELKLVVPKQRVDASVSSEMGMYHCESVGTYYFEFDNCYSWIHQKEVYHKIQVIKPCSNKDDV